MQKGEPNLTSDMFALWIKEDYDQETARLWLHSLGFGVLITKKEFTLMDTSAKMLYNTGVNF